MKQIKLMIMAILLLMIILTTNVYAVTEESFDLKLQSSVKNVNLGQTFSVDILLDNIHVTTGELGIGAYSAVITYDTSILEIVEATAASGWEIMTNEGNIVANTSNAEVVKEKQNTAKIKFKVKENAKLGNTEIKIENIEGSTAETTIKGKGISAQITVKEKEPEKPDDNNQDNNNEKPDDNNNANSDGNNQNNNNGNPDENVNKNVINGNNGQNNGNNKIVNSNTDKSQTKLPHTGISNILKILIVILIVVTIVIYIKYRRAI